jgi:hypothetical protein
MNFSDGTNKTGFEPFFEFHKITAGKIFIIAISFIIVLVSLP